MKWLVVAVTLIGLFGQLVLQSQARLDEMPRTTLERLTGLHIGPMPTADDMCMAMTGMDMGHAKRHAKSNSQHSHHDDTACFLCPLLHLPTIVLTAFLIALLIGADAERAKHAISSTPAALYSFHTRLPPPTGPPISA